MLSAEPLTTARDMLALTAAEAAGRHPALLRGVVTFCDAQSRMAYVQDETGGMRLLETPASPVLRPGLMIEVRGRSDPGQVATALVCAGEGSVRVLGEAPLPQALPFFEARARENTVDGRLVTFDAVLFHVDSNPGRPSAGNWLHFDFSTAFGRYTGYLRGDDAGPWQQWIHAKVRVTGVVQSVTTRAVSALGHVIYLQDGASLELLRAVPADPFDRPLRQVADLFRPGLVDPFEPVRIAGTVLNRNGRSGIHLRCGDQAISVRYFGQEMFQPGERIEVVAYPEYRNDRFSLIEGSFRRIGKSPLPAPLVLTPRQIIDKAAYAELVRFQATVLSNDFFQPGGRMLVQAGEQMVELRPNFVFIGPHTRAALLKFTRDSVVDVTGLVQAEGLVYGSQKPPSPEVLGILLRDPADLVMVRAAPWWTPARLLLLMAALLMVLALSILWTLLLRRRVAAQTMVIREKIAHETIWQERSRIARDIHDDVGASLTRIHLLGERGQRLASRPDEAGAQFSRIVQQSRDAVRALDGIVWAVNPKNDPLSHTILYLCQTAQDLSREAGLRCRLDIPDVLPEIALPAKLRHQLLLAAKEAIHNAIKHSAAQEIRLHLAIDPAQLRLEITDDGKGFDPAAASEVRTGLDSMRRRMEDAGCGFQLASLAGGGTTVTFLIPTHGSNSL